MRTDETGRFPDITKPDDPLRRDGMTRRDFLTNAVALGMTGTVASSIWNPPALAATPKRGGRLRVGVGGAQSYMGLDPSRIGVGWDIFVNFGQLRNCLVEVDHEFRAVPELATGWGSSPDAKVWTFELRKGVEFHNGKTLDAEDVIDSVNYNRHDESVARVLVEPIVDIKTDGNHTLVFTLREGNADFPFIMSDYHLGIFPAGTRGNEFAKGIGTGPYALDSFQAGARTLTKRNPNYWKAGRAHFDEVETFGINDENARINALRSGQIDLVNDPDRRRLRPLEQTSGLEVTTVAGTGHYTLPMRTDTAPFDDNDVRLALKYALDRDVLLETIFYGLGRVGNDHPIMPSNRFYASELDQRQYDPDRARFHLAKAGLSTLAVNLSTAEIVGSGAVDAVVLYREHAAKAGIDINVVREPDDTYWGTVWGQKPWYITGWSGRPTEDWMFSIAYAADAPWNESKWVHERFNELLKLARVELDEDKRRAMYVEMQQIMRDEGGAVIPIFTDRVMVHRDTLKHGPLAGNFGYDGYKLAERWWFG